ncbi:MAG: hypothetical protein MI919_08270 [Holophagales bacterium]|nr:hypothetical protein [Holophagales bacterium]
MSAGLTLMMPIPAADLAGATLIQIDMLAGLAENYRINFYEQRQKTYLAALLGAALPISAYRFLSSGIKAIPVVGQLTAAFFLPAMVGGATYATGKIFSRHFAQGGDLLDFEADRYRRYGEEQYAKGRAFVTDLVKSDRSKVIEAGTRAAAT